MGSGSEFDYSEFKAFANNFHKVVKQERFMRETMNELGNIMIRDVKMRTPVGSYDNKVFFVSNGKLLVFESPVGAGRTGGNLRRNWQLGKVANLGNSFVITILNNTEYGSFVELGHRTVTGGWVEGQFFLKITMEEMLEQLPKIVGPRFLDYLRKFGVD